MVTPTFVGHGSSYVSGRGWPQESPRNLESLKQEAESVMEKVSGLLLTGGGDVTLSEDPEISPERLMDRDRDFWEAALFGAALKLKKPVFGVCRGVQLMNMALGGTLWADIPTQYPGALVHQQVLQRHITSHKVILESDSQIAAICGQRELMVNSGHHQAIKEPAKELRVVGRSEDGLIEAVEMEDSPLVFGVQWHPEALVGQDPTQLALFEALVNAARS
jgi:putative glutamine amidotransferase